MKFEIIWTSDEHADIYLEGTHVGEMDHGVHGWDGIDGMHNLINDVAVVIGAEVVQFEQYHFED